MLRTSTCGLILLVKKISIPQLLDVDMTALIEFLHNSKFPANSCQDPANIDIQWVGTIEC